MKKIIAVLVVVALVLSVFALDISVDFNLITSPVHFVLN